MTLICPKDTQCVKVTAICHRRQLITHCTFKRAARIELASLAWKAKVLPLNYARSFYADFSI